LGHHFLGGSHLSVTECDRCGEGGQKSQEKWERRLWMAPNMIEIKICIKGKPGEKAKTEKSRRTF